MKQVRANPGHSRWYIERFRQMAADGEDIVGEARLIDAMVSRGSLVLDAGCGPGRNTGYLHAVGHRLVGVDVDPALIVAAREDYPGPDYVVSDLAEMDLLSHGIHEPLDAILCAGNVMTFLAPSTRVEVLRRFASHLAEDGRAVIGFGAGRGYPFPEFFDDAAVAGLEPQVRLSSWDLRPFTQNSEFLVAVLSKRAS